MVMFNIKSRVKQLFAIRKKIEPVYIPVFHNALLKGRKALVTGGTGGIGFAIARAFLDAGASVVITGRDELRINKAVNELNGKGYLGVCKGIVLDNRQVKRFDAKVNECNSLIGDIDVLVNNAGGFGGGNFGQTKEDDWDRIISTNVKGAYFLSQCLSEIWKAKKTRANILNVCSSSSLRPGQNPYIISKWGLRSMTLGLAKSLVKYNIVVNGIAPGPTDTDLMKGITNDSGLGWRSNPAGRLVTRQEVANLAVILVSDLSRMIVGDIVYVSGGAGVVTFDDV